MPFSLAKIKEKSLPASVKFAGEKLEFEFKPGKLDQSWYDKQSKAMEDEDMKQLVECVTDVLVSWNVTDENDEMIPLEAQTILDQDFPLPLFGLINQKIQQVAGDGGESVKKARS